jgi:vacuolar iron transporter family protein
LAESSSARGRRWHPFDRELDRRRRRSSATQNDVLIAGVAGLVAGAMSMAAGEYVSVSSQSDTEQADLARERKELNENPGFELDELADIYVKRGVDQT